MLHGNTDPTFLNIGAKKQPTATCIGNKCAHQIKCICQIFDGIYAGYTHIYMPHMKLLAPVM